MIEYSLYITNPMFYGSSQNNFEKNLSGKITISETIAASGMTERTAVGEVYGIPVPFTNPQTNLVVEDNDGKIIKYGEPSMFSPAKVLATEMMAILKDEFAIKYGVNIDFSTEAPKEAATITSSTPTTSDAPTTSATPTTTAATTTPSNTSVVNSNISTTDLLTGAIAAGALIGAGVASLFSGSGNGAATAVNTPNMSTIATMSQTTATMSTIATKPTIAPIAENKLKGIKILVPSQYLDVYEISKYGGVPALMTTKDSKQMVWLDKDYDRPEFLPSNLTSPEKVNDDGTGDFKINIHLGYPGGKKVGNWSEDGSQVFSTADELNDFFKLCEDHKAKHGNKLTYTLATREDWDEAQKSVQTNKAVPDPGTASTPPPAVEEKIVATASTPPEEIAMEAFKNLNFDTNKFDIKPESFESLDKLAELLRKETTWKITLEGHTDSVGSPESNLELSRKRAESAKKYLVDKGVTDAVISIESFGESKPLADNNTEEGRLKNRRVVIIITKPDNTTIIAGTSETPGDNVIA